MSLFPFLVVLCLSPCAVRGSAKPAQQRVVRVGAFSWNNCGGGKDPGTIAYLSIRPDPINIPGVLRVSAMASTSVILSTPLKVNVTLQKEVAGTWVKIPCVEQIGSCTYEDVCRLLYLAIPPGQSCPEPLATYGIPCHCPFQTGSYTLPETSFDIPNLGVPYWLTNGDYKGKAVMSSGNRELACVELSFSFKTT
uniref:Ganglioside GM2 activator n=1 Tax=Callorhinchus milii TaxID=7868 RepID=A0A4W3GCP6_CALMI|eukprot:gi/632967805/ref/XP_007900183.1/ PREDICTED: ganglioside GM2 activator [Callorhinchus milii]